MIDFFSQTLAWYFAGPLIAAVLLLLYYLGEGFGISSNLRTMCAIGGAGHASEFFRFNWKSDLWNLVLLAGVIIGASLSYFYFGAADTNAISVNTLSELGTLGLAPKQGQSLVPEVLFGSKATSSFSGIFVLLIGGLLVGFGARYAGGCTSGHAITGLSNLQLPSLIAVVGFFIGGLVMTHLLLPLLV